MNKIRIPCPEELAKVREHAIERDRPDLSDDFWLIRANDKVKPMDRDNVKPRVAIKPRRFRR